MKMCIRDSVNDTLNKRDFLIAYLGLNCLEYDLEYELQKNINTNIHREDVVEPSPVARKRPRLDYIKTRLLCLEYDLHETIKQNNLHREEVVEPSPVARKCLRLDYIRSLYRIDDDDDDDDIKSYIALLHYILQ